MKVRDEIEKYADTEDKECLLWLLTRYHMQSEFLFVAKCIFVRYGTASYKSYRKWKPTKEGKILYQYELKGNEK